MLERWKSLAAAKEWSIRELGQDEGYPILAIENDAAKRSSSNGLYVSAGVHGDECAPVWALLEWAASAEADFPLVLLPCLNPHGLVENTRVTSSRIDLNRSFQNTELPLIREWQNFLGSRRFDAAINLHEDYDANGIYLYELARDDSIGDDLLGACEALIPRETSSDVDGHEMRNGLLQRSGDVERIAREDLGGWPESIWLYLNHETNAYTFETPSEMDLERRVATQRRFIDRIVELKLS